MIHPAFDQIPDAAFAGACSELIQEGTIYTLADPAQDGFPPEPADITTVVAAYIDGEGGVRQRVAFGLSGQDIDPQPAEVTDLYAATVGRYQEMAPTLAAVLLHSGPRLEEWAINAVSRHGKRLVAAHVIARTLKGGELVDSLAYPGALGEEASMRLREGLVAVVSQMRGTVREDAKDELGSFLRLEENSSASEITASIFLPPVEAIRRLMQRGPS